MSFCIDLWYNNEEAPVTLKCIEQKAYTRTFSPHDNMSDQHPSGKSITCVDCLKKKQNKINNNNKTY